MDILDFVVVMVIVIVTGYLIRTGLNLADARARIELQKRLAKTKERPIGNQRGQEPQNMKNMQNARGQPPLPVEEIGSWVPQLLEEFGIDPDLIFEEEMPQELATFLPMAKAYVSSQGGLGGIVQKFTAAKQQGSAPPEENNAI